MKRNFEEMRQPDSRSPEWNIIGENRKFRILFGGMSVTTDIPLYNAKFFLCTEWMFGIIDL